MKVLFTTGALSFIAIFTVSLIATAFHPQYDPLQDTFSLLGSSNSPASTLYNTTLFCAGVLLTYFGLAIRCKARWTSYGIIGFGTCLMLLALFPYNHGADAINTYHLVIAQIAVVAIVWSMLSLSFANMLSSRMKCIHIKFFSIASASSTAVLGFMYLASHSTMHGLLQRLMYCIIALWLILIGFVASYEVDHNLIKEQKTAGHGG